jgi:hypothetical protein
MDTQNREIHILCDGVELPLVPYISELFSATISSMVGTLKGAKNASEITITISRKPDNVFKSSRTIA